MTKITSYKDLNVWKEAMDLTTHIYKQTSSFPKEELFGLISQMRRASVSVPSNIAEGHARYSIKEYIHHLSYSIGSLAELERQIQIAFNLNYIDNESLNFLFVKTQKTGALLGALIKSLKNKV